MAVVGQVKYPWACSESRAQCEHNEWCLENRVRVCVVNAAEKLTRSAWRALLAVRRGFTGRSRSTASAGASHARNRGWRPKALDGVEGGRGAGHENRQARGGIGRRVVEEAGASTAPEASRRRDALVQAGAAASWGDPCAAPLLPNSECSLAHMWQSRTNTACCTPKHSTPTGPAWSVSR
ncbi:hypothetical protein IQ07DRAFT_359407 [Pyrenochaeta sp. DS3sAY3a]|nr:hypothetical protein IQ07DRAFT_359407 [Pyrenochaeta sp. DS3sAY3a]